MLEIVSDYKIVMSKNINVIEQDVTLYVGLGWRPHGNLFQDALGYYVQSMVKVDHVTGVRA